MGQRPPLGVRRAQALPCRHAEGIQELIGLPTLSPQRQGGHQASLVWVWRSIPRATATAARCGTIQERAAWDCEGLQALSPCCRPPLGACITPPALRMVHDVVSLENVVQRLRTPFCHYRATTRTVHTGGLVPCTQPRLPLDLPQGTHVMVRGEGQDAILSAGDQMLCRMTGHATCHPCM